MTKAYDRLEWPFLFAVLRKFGFSEVWLKFIQRMFTQCWFSVIFNGAVKGDFPSSRGLRQGDPLAPSLFILAEEALSRGLFTLFHSYSIKAFATSGNGPIISHLLYADDTIIFTNGTKSSLNKLMTFLSSYEAASGQLINKEKSCYILSESDSRAETQAPL